MRDYSKERMTNLSIVLIVRNEERNITECLGSVKGWADEIVVVDQSSTDRTVELSRRYTDKVFITEPKDICNPDRMFGIEKAKNEWNLLLEADERVTTALKEEIDGILENDANIKGEYYIPVKSYFCGRWIKHCGWYPAYNLRLFKKGYVYFPPTLHTDGRPKGPAGYLSNPLLHYSYPSIEDYLPKLNRYTRQWAKEAHEKGVRVKGIGLVICFLIKPLYHFLRKYFLLGGYKEGFLGFFISVSSGLTIFMNYAKLWELQFKRTINFKG